MTPQIVAASPAWKPLTVLQMSAVGPRSSTKNVSVPLPPVRKFEPVPPSRTLMPLLAAIASFPLPLWMNQLGVLTLIFRLSEVMLMYSHCSPLTGPVYGCPVADTD